MSSSFSSFARYMSSQGFDTWILEYRGAGLSEEVRTREVKRPVTSISEQVDLAIKHGMNGASSSELQPSISSDAFAEYKDSAKDGVHKDSVQTEGWQVTRNRSLHGGNLAVCNALPKMSPKKGLWSGISCDTGVIT
ncbi:unnamed protein product [Ilex paraguariensis]|uniref:Uncharacterized protein n=1 Tax=Ilex paraguariensis TaxID=185542 RepID=A0ABC8R2W1_9AQUA